ncbi:MAG: bifunctional precorrin-2 dehydrogenase/sirohydrochlorin ferrochelatase [Bacteroidetes bacterium]|nr:MAG: bifunctional precorrin-2 dehydrogenase/sirohydrochlorin ferrochelatase [Bacteroidota bacterium]
MNKLFPIFLKLHEIDTLLVGGGNVGLEKLNAVLKNSPEARLTVVADRLLPEVRELICLHPQVKLHERKFEFSDLAGKQLVILATDNPDLHKEIKETTKKLGILTNVADTPHICDFYLGSVVRKGDLKIAISTNGKSPTFAKRFREYLEEALPDDIQTLLDNLQAYRNTLKGDFQHKIEALNKITAEMLKIER